MTEKYTMMLPDGFVAAIKRPLQFEFTPQSDITAYELARCLPYFHGQQVFSADDFGDLRRHFKVGR